MFLHDPGGLDPNSALDHFRALSHNSREYQGHGWGCAWVDEQGMWKFHHDIRPIWEDDDNRYPRTSLFLAHARSAFKNEGIVVENNMPFTDGRYVFIFNGELRGVKIKSEGRIGAEKIFNFIRRLDKGDMNRAITRATDIIRQRTRYIRAMNFVLADCTKAYVYSAYNEDPDYFQMCRRQTGNTVEICSEPYPADDSDADNGLWTKIGNGALTTLDLVRTDS